MGGHRILYVLRDDQFEETVQVLGGEENNFSHRFLLFGRLRILCGPYASVRIDGEEVGFTPITIEKIEAGRHRLALYREGYETIEEAITIHPTILNRFQFSLVEKRP